MDIAIIGGGVTGLEAANALSALGYTVTVFERSAKLGGHVAQWDRLFPTRRPSSEVTEALTATHNQSPKVMLSTEVMALKHLDNQFVIETPDKTYNAKAVLLATGFDLFPAEKKEEYGYGIYENVITSADLEKMFATHGKPLTTNGLEPKRIAFIHCVGSRDAKVNRTYCSKVCCVTAVKQAIETKEVLPDAEVFCLYMDLRMFGPGYEDLYKEAQQVGVNFIRGRLSEASELTGGRVQIKTEDTLSSRPLKMSVDLVVLMVGISPPRGMEALLSGLGLTPSNDGFAPVADQHLCPTNTTVAGLFVAGACTGPNNITDSVNAARSAATQIHQYLSQK